MQRKKKWKKIVVSLATLTITFFCLLLFSKEYVLADADEATIAAVIGNFPELFEKNSMANDVLRNIIWQIICILKFLADAAGGLYQQTLGLIDMTTTMTNENIISQYQQLFTALLAVSIMVLGIVLILKREKKNNLLSSLFLIVIAFATPNWILLHLTGPVRSACLEIAGTNTITSTVINNHLYDLLYIDKTVGLASLVDAGFALQNNHAPDTGFDVEKVDINEIMNYERSGLSEAASGQNGILGQQLSWYVDASGTYTYEMSDIYNGFGWNSEDSDDWFNEFYYRYHYEALEIILTMIALIFVYIFVSYKVVRMILEIIMGRLLIVFYSANLNAEQKTVQILKHIINCYVILLSSAILIKVFTLGENYISQRTDGLTYCLILIFWAFAIIDGPNILQQLTGVDAGLSSMFGKVASTYYAGKAVASAAKGIGSGIGKIMSRGGTSESGASGNRPERNHQSEGEGKQGNGHNSGDGKSSSIGAGQGIANSQENSGGSGYGDNSAVPPDFNSAAQSSYARYGGTSNMSASGKNEVSMNGNNQKSQAQTITSNSDNSSTDAGQNINNTTHQESGNSGENQMPDMPFGQMGVSGFSSQEGNVQDGNMGANAGGTEQAENLGQTPPLENPEQNSSVVPPDAEYGGSYSGADVQEQASGFHIPQSIDLGSSTGLYQTPTDMAKGMDEAWGSHSGGNSSSEINGISDLGKKEVTRDFKDRKGRRF